MPIYRSLKKETFLDELIAFTYANFKNELYFGKIILPNGYLCNYLQRIIINKIGTTLLPSIIPINDISSEKEETFKIPSEQIGKVTSLEERMILAEIINSYKVLNYNIPQSLNLSSSLAKLFFEFEANNVDLTDLKNIPTLDQAEHWHFIYDFLEFAYLNWQKKITHIKKLTPSQHMQLMFNTELERVRKGYNWTIIAGVLGNNQITRNFISEISKLKNGYIILPPCFGIETAPQDDDKTTIFLPEEPLYNLIKLMSQIDVNVYNIKMLGDVIGDIEKEKNSKIEVIADLNKTTSTNFVPTILDNLLIKTPATQFSNNIEYIEFDYTLLEAEYIILKCHALIAENSDSKIAILITDDKIKNYFTAKLYKNGLEFSDLIGDNILTTPLTTLILEIAVNISKNFSLKDFISLISHPLVISEETRKLKKLIVKHNRFTQKIEDISKVINENFTDNLHLEKLHNICNLIKVSEYPDFNSFFTKVIKIVEKLCPNIWSKPYSNKIADLIAEIIKANWNIKVEDLESFPEIIKNLIAGGRIYNNEASNANITICSPQEVIFINYDLLIYTNFNENSHPLPQINNPWLNNQMIEKLALHSSVTRLGNSMYDFYLNLHNKKILITRSIKTNDSSLSAPSSFILRLKHILGEDFKQKSAKLDLVKPDTKIEEYIYCEEFPDQISVTDIETLIRAPYNFYAKKILNLRMEEEIEDSPKFSEFGSFFHRVVELYTKNFNDRLYPKSLVHHANKLLDHSIFPKQTKQFWLYKITALEEEFILFDNQRRGTVKEIFSEVRGEMTINIASKKVKIVAIADRIELTANSKAIIIDYKTGVVPTKKEVLSGLSPQLVIEAIILLEGGFKTIQGQYETESLTYIKINNNEPFISSTTININRSELLRYKEQLVNLLAHYITTKKYPIKPNSMKYDDYRHLARR